MEAKVEFGNYIIGILNMLFLIKKSTKIVCYDQSDKK